MKRTKTTIPEPLRSELSMDPFYKVCALSVFPGHICAGEINYEHAIVYASKAVQKHWSIIPICEGGHNTGMYQDAGTMRKELHVWVALARATPDDLKEMCNESAYRVIGNLQKSYTWLVKRDALMRKYGPYVEASAIKAYVPPKHEARVSPSRIEPYRPFIGKTREYRINKVREYFENKEQFHTKDEIVGIMVDAFYDAVIANAGKAKGIA